MALTNSAGTIVATLDISDVFEWDKPRYIKSVYLTERTDHPGADMVLKGDADKTHLLGGTIRVLPQPKNPKFGKYVLSPREVRKLLAEQGLEPRRRVSNPQSAAPGPRICLGLRPGNAAASRAQRRRRLNPLIGETKGDDVNADVRMHTYEALIDTAALGEGDSDRDAVGPRERIGARPRDPAGPGHQDVLRRPERSDHARHLSPELRLHRHRHRPQARRRSRMHDGTAIWGDFDAQEIFGKLKGDLKIKPVKVGFAAYYDSAGRVDLMEKHKDEKPVFISGKDVRKTLLEGKTGRSADHAREHVEDSRRSDGTARRKLRTPLARPGWLEYSLGPVDLIRPNEG